LGNKNIELKDFLRKVPKTEIHLHLEGLASVDTIWTLKQKHGLELKGINNRKDLVDSFNVTSLDEFINLFINVIQFCFRSNEDLSHLIDDLARYMEANNIIYTEVFVAPTSLLKTGLTFEGIMAELEKGAERIKQEYNRDVFFIMDVSRGFGLDNAMSNLNQTLSFLNSSVIGIGLGGAESKGKAHDFASVFKKAASNNLKIVAHAGEVVGPESIWEAVDDLKAVRIGHGISAREDKKLRDYLKEKNIVFEVCPTSNLFTRTYVNNLKEHPIRLFYDEGLFVTLNTDDPTIFQIDLVEEYFRLSEDDFFSEEEICKLLSNGIDAIFADQSVKDKLHSLQQPYLDDFLRG